MPQSRQIKYTGKDFPEFKEQLENLAKQYFPDQFSNFNEHSIEMMLLEMMAYTGDVISFNTDENFKQLFQKYAYEPEAIFRNARAVGYNPETVSVAVGEVQISQIVPAYLNNGEYVPDKDYAGIVGIGSRFTDFTGESKYTTIEDVNMKDYENSILEETDTNENPAYYRIFKTAKVRSGKKLQKEIAINDPQANLKLFVDDNVAYIDSVEDSEGNIWYQVDYLSEDTIFEAIKNENLGINFEQYTNTNPYVLKLRRASRRFTVEHNSKGECYLIFGQGKDVVSDDIQNLTIRDLLTTNQQATTDISNTFVVENFLNSDSYGLAPHNTTLIINYIVSDGNTENANANTVVSIERMNLSFSNNSNELIRNSFEVENLDPIVGGRFLNDPDYIKNMSSKSFLSQRRCVTDRDYIVRTLLMPPKFGNISKAFTERTDSDVRTLNLYVLSKNKLGNLENTTNLTKENLSNYLEKYRMISDGINIIDPYIINIGVDFKFTSVNGYSIEKAIRNVSQKIEEFFNVDNFEISQPIVIEQLKNKMSEADGVLTINSIEFVNKWKLDGGYSGVKYDVHINGSNYDNGILYPPADVGIFELKFPKRDIRGSQE